MSELAKRDAGLLGLLEKMKPAIAQALPKHISAERMARIAMTAVRSNAQLAKCSPVSFLGSLLQASQLGLEVNTPLGHAYLIPYKDVATLVIGYQGMLDLARRSGLVKAIYAHPVFEGDEFDYELGLEPKLRHKPKEQSDVLTHVYAVARLLTGEPIFTVLTRAKVETFRARSRASGSGPWVTDFDAMAMKTAVRRLWSWLPKSAEQAVAQRLDEALERDVDQREQFSPEVQSVLDTVSEAPEPTPAPSPVPTGTPEGRRVKMPGRAKPAPAAATPAGDQPKQADSWGKAPETPAPSITPPPVDVAELHQALGEVDPDWESVGTARIVDWSQEQQRAALHWARAVLLNAPGTMSIQANRPPFTVLGRQPGED